MKKILFFITSIILLTNIIVHSQTMSYSFTQSSTSYSSIGTGTSPGANFTGAGIATNAVSAAITLPFTFTFNGVAQTQIYISNNGFITFGATAPTVATTNPISAATGYAGAIAGYGFNLVNSTVSGATPDITYTTIGSSPSRTFIVEYKDVSRTGITGDRMNFQIRLSETTNEINIVYGTWAATTTTTAVGNFGMVGLRGSANTFYNTRQVNSATPHNTWATSGSAADNGATSRQTLGVTGGADGPNSMRYNSTFLPSSGQVYTWTPIATSFYQSIPYTQNFETWSDLFAKNDKSGNGILSHPSSGNSSWRNYNETITNSYWSSTNGRPTLGVGQGTGAASFYNYGAASGRKGYLDFYLNLSASGSKVLTFDLINQDPGTLAVQLSTDGGVTFSSLTGFTTTSLSSWATQTVSIGSTTSSTCVLRFLFTSTYGSYNAAIDNINVFVPATPTISSFTPNTDLCTGGGQTVTITGTNFTGATQVQFNGTNATSYSVVSSTSITAVTPSSLTAGNITVTTGGGTATSTAYTVLSNPTVTVAGSSTKYCGNTPVTLTASGATTYTWSAVTDLYTNAAGTISYTALTNANPVYSKANANIIYTVIGTTSGCTASNTITVNKGNFVTISSVTPQTLSACSGNTDSITVVASVSSTASTYIFSSGTGASFETISSPTTLTSVVSGTLDDGSNPVTPSPSFTFPYAGTNYTDFNVNTNGWMKMLAAAPSSNIPSSLTSIGSTAGIYMFGRDANLNTANGGSMTHGYATGGKYVIQFNNNSGGASGGASATSYVNAQIVLWGSTSSSPGKIEIIYGTSIGTPGSNGTIGISDIANNYMNAVTGNSTALTTATAWPSSGTNYTFIPTTLTYAWTSLNPANTLINTTLPTTVATITDTGKFQIVVTETNGCSTLDSTVKIYLGGGNPNITVMNATNNSYCYTDSTFLSTNVIAGCPPYSYSWSGGLGSTAIVKAKPTSTTKYYLTVTDANSNIDIDSITISIISPQILTSQGDTICGTDTAHLSATNNFGETIAWYNKLTGGNLLKTGANLDTVLSANDTFYVGSRISAGSSVVTFGAGGGTSNIAGSPFYYSWGGAKTQYIILASELTSAGITSGNISNLALNISAIGNMTTNDTLFISMGTTSQTTATATHVGGTTLVYYSPTGLNFTSTGWNTFNFISPFYWDGASNLVVQFAWSRKNSGSSPGATIVTNNTIATLNTYSYADSRSALEMLNTMTGATGGSGSSTNSTTRPQFKFGVEPFCQSTRIPVVVIRNTPPAITVSSSSNLCSGLSTSLTVSSPNDPNYTYTWNPGALSGASHTVYPISTTTYTLNALDNSTGCRNSGTTTITVLPSPTKPILNVDSVYLCNGTVQPLTVTNGGGSGLTSVVRNSLGKTVPDNISTGVFDSITISGVPAGATIDSIVVNLKYNMTYDGDIEVNLQAPNGQILNLIADNAGLDVDFNNTRISSNLSNPLLPTSSGSGGAPFTGTYSPTAATTGLIATTNLPTTTNFNNLFSTPNGLWICRTYDDGSGDVATWNNWRLFIYYTMPTTSWSPTTGLYTTSSTSTAYTTGDSITVYAKPTVSTDYVVTRTASNGCNAKDTAKYVLKSPSSSVALFNSSTNASPLTLVCEDGTWTYYADPSNNNRWLFAIDWDTNLVAKSTAQIQLTYNTSGIKSDVKLRSGSSADYDGSFIMNRYWNVNNASLNPGSNPVKIRYFYDPTDITNATNMMTDSMNKYQALSPGGNTYYSTGWKWFKTVGIPFSPTLINDGNNFGFAHLDLNPTSTGTINGVTYVEFDTITSFSGGSGGVGFTPHAGVGLPVSLINFKGEVKEAYNYITWTTASEINNHHFELESSIDGIQFSKIATLAGHGTTTTTNYYSFNDYKYNMPATYYRLKQVDNDGRSTTTNMIILTRKSSAAIDAVISVYPNPTTDNTTISIDVQENTDAVYTIHDISGKIIKSGNITCKSGVNNTNIETSELTDGLYIIDVLINGKHVNTRIVKTSN